MAGAIRLTHQLREPGRRHTFGLGWMRTKLPTGGLWWHNGGTGGFRSFAGFSPDRGRAAVVLIHDPEHGEFRITTVELNPPRHAAFRWQPTGPDDPATLTEFWIDDRSDGGVSLRVVESGFDDLPADKLHAFVKDNSQGWEFELAVARTAAEAG